MGGARLEAVKVKSEVSYRILYCLPVSRAFVEHLLTQTREKHISPSRQDEATTPIVSDPSQGPPGGSETYVLTLFWLRLMLARCFLFELDDLSYDEGGKNARIQATNPTNILCAKPAQRDLNNKPAAAI